MGNSIKVTPSRIRHPRRARHINKCDQLLYRRVIKDSPSTVAPYKAPSDLSDADYARWRETGISPGGHYTPFVLYRDGRGERFSGQCHDCGAKHPMTPEAPMFMSWCAHDLMFGDPNCHVFGHSLMLFCYSCLKERMVAYLRAFPELTYATLASGIVGLGNTSAPLCADIWHSREKEKSR